MNIPNCFVYNHVKWNTRVHLVMVGSLLYNYYTQKTLKHDAANTWSCYLTCCSMYSLVLISVLRSSEHCYSMLKGVDKWNLFSIIKYKPCLARKSASVMGQPCSNSPTGALILTGNLLLCVLKIDINWVKICCYHTLEK